MPCPDLGALRASLDDAPGATPTPLHDHVRACASCRDALTELRRNAELAAPATALTSPDPVPAATVAAAFARLEQRRARLLAARTATAAAATAGGGTAGTAAGIPEAATPRPRRGRLAALSASTRAAAAALVAAVVLTGLVATPSGRAAAAGFLAQFRSERFAVISLSRSQLVQLNTVMSQLVGTGVFSGDQAALNRAAQPTAVGDLAAAGRLARFQVRGVDPSSLPRGVAATPGRILATSPRTVRLTLDRDRAIDYFRRHGQPGFSIPARFEGARLLVHVPGIVVQEYDGGDGAPRLLVGTAGTIGMDAEGGASLEELRELVLRLPGLPAGMVAQLRGISDWRTTLPLPVPTDQARWRPTTVAGADGLSFADPAGKLHGLLWQRDGRIWGVAGVLGAGEALDVANGLG
ncbi:MAG TPA: hypothetical protein VF486_27200 [Actinomycetes bacterium]